MADIQNSQNLEKGDSQEDDETSSEHSSEQFPKEQHAPGKYKDLKVKNEDLNLEESLFVPHFKKGYSLLYAPSNIFMFIKFFYALYERILKAKDLIIDKILEDLQEMNASDRAKTGISDQEIAEARKGNFVPDENTRIGQFYIERYEYLLKGIYATTSQQTIQGTLSPGLGQYYSHS